MDFLESVSDHLHDIAFVPGDEQSGEPGHFERIAEFDWASSNAPLMA